MLGEVTVENVCIESLLGYCVVDGSHFANVRNATWNEILAFGKSERRVDKVREQVSVGFLGGTHERETIVSARNHGIYMVRERRQRGEVISVLYAGCLLHPDRRMLWYPAQQLPVCRVP